MLRFLKKIFGKRMIGEKRSIVFSVIAKNDLISGKYYQAFNPKAFDKGGNSRDILRMAIWHADRDCFVSCCNCYSYEEFNPIREADFWGDDPVDYTILDYNPEELNGLDLQNLREIILSSRDTATSYKEIFEDIEKYFVDRGLI